MDVTQVAFGIFSIFTAIVMAVTYWIDSNLRGIYIGWLLAALAGVTIPELFVGLAGMIT